MHRNTLNRNELASLTTKGPRKMMARNDLRALQFALICGDVVSAQFLTKALAQ